MQSDLKFARTIAYALDNKFEIFGFRFGITSILQLIPEVGDFLDVILSLYIIGIALKLKLPIEAVFRMIGNIVFSFFVGLIPILGDGFYIVYKPNTRNVKILEEYARSDDKREIEEGKIVT